MRIPRLLLGATLALALAAGGASAQSKEESLEETARSAIQALMEVMQAVIAKIPMYEAPVILENGDILIRRKKPDPAPQPKPPNGSEQKT